MEGGRRWLFVQFWTGSRPTHLARPTGCQIRQVPLLPRNWYPSTWKHITFTQENLDAYQERELDHVRLSVRYCIMKPPMRSGLEILLLKSGRNQNSMPVLLIFFSFGYTQVLHYFLPCPGHSPCRLSLTNWPHPMHVGPNAMLRYSYKNSTRDIVISVPFLPKETPLPCRTVRTLPYKRKKSHQFTIASSPNHKTKNIGLPSTSQEQP